MSQFRKIWAFSLPLLLWLALAPPAQGSEAEPWPEPAGAAYAVLEAESGAVLYSQAGEQALPPASTGKIATALLALSLSDDLERRVIISEAAAAVGESSIYLQAGEELSLADLLKGALVRSGNDACFALAEAVAGSEGLFVHWLNMQALLLGAYSACFKNTNGLPAAGHQIAAVDLARITARALDEPFFAEVVASKYAELGGESNYRYFRNTNKLLWRDQRVVGVKTGTTEEAGACLVAALRQGEACYISVAFDSADRYGGSYALLTHAAANYPLLTLVRSGQALACYEGELLYAADTVSLLRPEGAGGLRVRWQLPHRLLILDEAGREVGGTALLTGAELAGTGTSAPN